MGHGSVAWAVCVLPGCLYWFYVALATARSIHAVPVLEDIRPPDPPRWPRVSVVVAARDEAEGIEAAMISRLADDYPDLEVVLVDDRSTDGTGAIVDALAARDARVQAVHVTELPEGWLGKLHAMQQGYTRSTGEWLLFSDADVHVEKGTLRRAVAYCEARGLDHLSVVPEVWSTGFWLDVVFSTFFRTLLTGARLWAVPDPHSRAAVGGGLFNLVRRETLERTRGLPWLKLEVADDVALAQMLKRAGARPAVVNARGMVRLQFYTSMGDMARSTDKAGYPIVGGYSMARLLAVCAVGLVLELGPWVTLCASLVAPHAVPLAVRLACAAAVASSVGASLAMNRWMRRPLAPALPVPAGTLMMLFFLLRSGWLAVRRGGVVWRTTLYPNAVLRAGSRLEIP